MIAVLANIPAFGGGPARRLSRSLVPNASVQCLARRPLDRVRSRGRVAFVAGSTSAAKPDFSGPRRCPRRRGSPRCAVFFAHDARSAPGRPRRCSCSSRSCSAAHRLDPPVQISSCPAFLRARASSRVRSLSRRQSAVPGGPLYRARTTAASSRKKRAKARRSTLSIPPFTPINGWLHVRLYSV